MHDCIISIGIMLFVFEVSYFDISPSHFSQMQHATSISAEEQRIAALRSGQMQDGGG